MKGTVHKVKLILAPDAVQPPTFPRNDAALDRQGPYLGLKDEG
jgi:hypothetical protein